MSYNHTKSRVLQWLGIILIIGVFGGAYWYFQVYGSTLNQSQNDLNTTNLVGLWSFNGDDISGTTAYDRSASGNNGTLTNGPAKTLGKIGQALNFFPNGSDTNAYVTMGDPGSGALDFGSGDFSVGFWMKGQGYNNQTSSVNVAVSKKNNDVGGSAGYLFYYTSSNLMVFRLGNGTTDYEVTAPTTTVNDNQWHRYTGLRSGSTISLYIDGSLVGSTGSASGSVSNSDPFLVGGDLTNTRNVNGSIEEVRVYNVALTADQIRSAYVQGNGTKVNTSISNPQGTGRLDSGLVNYWKFDENTGTSTSDSSTNALTGTLTSGPTWTTGQIGSAVNFDGTDDYITATDSDDSKYLGDLTICTWANIETNGNYRHFVGKHAGSGGSQNPFDFRTNSPATALVLVRANSSSVVWTGAQVTLGQWQYYCVVSSTAVETAPTFYVNGVAAAAPTSSGTATGAPTGSSAAIRIGVRADDAVKMDGSMDEMRIYSRKLSADEINQLYRLSTPTAVETGLKIYYSFDGQDTSGTTTYDRSGVGNTGTLTNGPTKTAGRVGQALSFDGSNDYVDTATNTVYNGQFTVAIWFLTNNNSQTGMIFGDSTGSAGGGIKTGIVSGNFFVRPVSSSDTSIPVPAAGQWHHIVMTRNSSDKIDFYLDGGDAKRLFSDVAQGGSFTPDKLGCNGSTPDQCFTGKLDEFRSYNRALTGAEVKSLYAAGEVDKMNSSLSQPQGNGRLDSDLAGYWALDDGSGSSAVDGSTNANTGTLSGTPTWSTGQVGGAIDFDGSDDYVSYANNIPFNSEDFSISARIRRDGAGGGADGTSVIFSQRINSTGTGQPVVQLYLDSSHRPAVLIRDNVGAAVTINSTTATTVGQWYHVVAVKTSSQILLYVDNLLVASSSHSLSGDFDANADIRNIGKTNFDLTNYGYFNGIIDDVRVYKRALSIVGITQLSNITSSTGVDTGLKGYWSFNGPDVSGTAAYDRSGAGNTGTLTNGPTKAIGKVGQALSFDGTNDYTTVADSSSLKPTAAISYGGWVYVPSTPGGLKSILEKGTATTAGYGLYVTSDPKFCFIIKTGGGSETDASPAITTGMWHHVMVTYDSATPVLYVDGTSQSLASGTSCTASTNTGAITQDTSTLTFGSRQGSSQFLTGRADELRVYNRALSAAEVAALYNQGL